VFRSLCAFLQTIGLLLIPIPTGWAGEVEVLHFWTSPGEARSIEEIKRLIAARGHTWKDFSVVGGGGGNAMEALKRRLSEGNPPASATIKGPALQEMAARKVFANLDVMAQFDHWDKVIPGVVKNHVQFKGSYISVPVNIHRANWLWINAEVMRRAGIEKPPESMKELLLAAERIRAAGFIPLAHGGQSWQDFLLFESVAVDVMGADLYRRVFVDGDPASVKSQRVADALRVFHGLKKYTDPQSKGRSWDETTRMVIDGRAAFQMMGDWAKGEFLVAGKKPGVDFLCVPSPGSKDVFAYVVDTFAMFQLRQWESQKAQGFLAYVLMSPEFQEGFSYRKGSIPARSDIKLDRYDACAKRSRSDFDVSTKKNLAIPSAAVDMALPTLVKGRVQEAISAFWNDADGAVEVAVVNLEKALSAKGN
jgi:glucose/mannose transport system substrate-binding protein